LVTDPPLDAGRRLIDALAASSFPMRAAGWINEDGTWKLYFVVPSSEDDRVRLYVAVAYKIRETLPPDERDLSYQIVDENHVLGRAVTAWTRLDGPPYRRTQGPVGTEAYISDAYIYRAAA